MNDVFFARAQMGLSLAFHIVFAAIGVAMPALMVGAEVMWRRSGDGEWLELARRWAKGTAVFFAVGAVSGTVLSFELGLLFPRFMEQSGAVIGLPFALEGFAFFTEAIFLGLYLYGWDRMRPALHVAAGAVVAVSGAASAAFVTIVNAWMNAPRGFRLEGDALVEIDPARAMSTPYAPHEVVHTVLAAYMATALAVAAIHAWALARGAARASFHQKALALALAMAVPTSLAQPLVGHRAGQVVAELQPLKLAAMEQLERTQAYAPLEVGPVRVPGALSLMAFNRPSAVVRGLEEWPAIDHPPATVKPAFQLMVGLGTLAAAYALYTLVVGLRRRALPTSRRWLLATVALGPTGVIAMEAGWLVTELGRQPWVVYGVLRTRDAVTPMPGLVVPFVTFAIVYAALAAVVAAVFWAQVRPTAEAA